ncbi:MAG TPA: outer membrane beta-barrel domain-containing protein [Myxococcota bacterium]|nr:outer membrane beta-barrel domain-containing protein [Myxococcota bacterium]HRY95167.1 outer membrane beta-barrel domain-containing protein [Myxococcota bacterium]HSA20912.1 outer membrane beta-barrel domain-containing protein [Myxococcota bacterium]
MHPERADRGRWCLWLGLTAVVLLAAVPLRAETTEEGLDQGRVYAIQDRAFRMNHEFGLSLGFLPLDAFYKMFSIGGHYVVHFDEMWAWEAVHLTYSKYLDVDTGLRSELADRWDASPTDPEENRIDFALDTNLMWKPLYGKSTLLGDTVIFGETYLLLGIGTEKFETAWYPAINLGLGMRIFLGETISMRLEVREYIHFGESTGGTLLFALSFCYNAFAEDLLKPAALPVQGVTP